MMLILNIALFLITVNPFEEDPVYIIILKAPAPGRVSPTADILCFLKADDHIMPHGHHTLDFLSNLLYNKSGSITAKLKWQKEENVMKIVVDYYPEHWDESLWEKDAELMRETGVSIVRMAEFAWCRLEPREGEFDFEWLDRAIDLFAQRGIDVVLCTPTSCPPLWLYEKYPDAVQTGNDGNKIATGIRGHRCYNNPDLLRYSDSVRRERCHLPVLLHSYWRPRTLPFAES